MIEHKELKKIKEQIKQGSLGSLAVLIEDMLSESQDTYNKCTERFEYHQSRVNVLTEVKALLLLHGVCFIKTEQLKEKGE